MTDRELMQQALEAMKKATGFMSDSDYRKLNESIEVLRAALAEPVQEPFGYLWPTGRHPEFRFTQQRRDGVDGMPLYTAPPQRKPLTDEEINALELPPSGTATVRDLVRLIERAHGIGGSNE